MTKTGDPGPLRMKHFFVIADDYNDYCWGIESKDKSSTGEFMSSFIKFLKEHRNKIKYIRTDGDGIFDSHEWNVLLDTFDITPVLAPSHEHWLQGKVEKKIQDLRTAANTIRYHHQVPKNFQLPALKFAIRARAHNRCTHNNRTVTPYEMLYSEKTDLRYDFIPFSMVWLLTRHQDKELPKARAEIFIGYNTTSMRRRVYECMYINEHGKIIILKSVYRPRFIETRGFKDVYTKLANKYRYMDEHNIKNTQEIQ